MRVVIIHKFLLFNQIKNNAAPLFHPLRKNLACAEIVIDNTQITLDVMKLLTDRFTNNFLTLIPFLGNSKIITPRIFAISTRFFTACHICSSSIISSRFSRASFSNDKSCGYLIFCGAQVESTIKSPLLGGAELLLSDWFVLSFSGGLESSLFSITLVALAITISFISPNISGVKRLRKCTIRDESNGILSVYSQKPQKYCK